MRTRAAICFLSLLNAACYRYAATDVAPAAGNTVRIDLTEAGTQRLGPVLGRNAIAVEGTILTTNDTSVVLSVSGTRQRDEQPLAWAGERVIVPRTAIRSTEARSLDKKRTFFVAGAVVLGAIAVKLILTGIDALAGGDDGGTTPTPP